MQTILPKQRCALPGLSEFIAPDTKASKAAEGQAIHSRNLANKRVTKYYTVNANDGTGWARIGTYDCIGLCALFDEKHYAGDLPSDNRIFLDRVFVLRKGSHIAARGLLVQRDN